MVPWMESEIEVQTNIAFLWLPPCPHILILKGSSCFLGFLLLTSTLLGVGQVYCRHLCAYIPADLHEAHTATVVCYC
jgi:hypothetical protein